MICAEVRASGNDRRREGRKGFTLIELLVVIAIIGLLLSVMIPALKKAKAKARQVICKSNLHQWGVVFLMYTQSNHDQFWIEYNVWRGEAEFQGCWMPYLASLYGEADKLRTCPEATRPTTPEGGIGTTTTRWGGVIMELHKFTTDPEKTYGSYGTNLWINKVDPPQFVGWRNPDLQWQTTLVTEVSPSTIPMVADCVWFGTNPTTYNAPGGNPTPSRDYWETLDPIRPGNWDRDMGRLTIDRHNKAINMTLMDGSTERVHLNRLWQYNWHRDYERRYDIEIPWLKP